MKKVTGILASAAIVVAAFGPASAETDREGALKAHKVYLAAINSNNREFVLSAVTDDIVLIAPNAPAMVGKAQVGPWVGGYFDAFETTWEKESVEFVVAGDWAFERYVYKVTEVPRDGGSSHTETGNGMNIYRLGQDGVWRVASDVWSASHSAPTKTGYQDWITCVGLVGPC